MPHSSLVTWFGWAAIALVLGGLALFTLADWHWDTVPTRLTLLVSGDTAGWIVPCGCTANQSGGLPRRGSYVESLHASAAVILADAGGAPGGTSDYHRVKFEAILRGEGGMGLVAHNLGGPEAALGADYLRRV